MMIMDNINISTERNAYTNINSSLKTCYFKHPWTGQKFTIELDYNLELTELKHSIDELVFNNFGFREYDIVESGQEDREMAQPIRYSYGEKLNKYLYTAFYIRPIGVPIPQSFIDSYEARIRRRNGERNSVSNIISNNQVVPLTHVIQISSTLTAQPAQNQFVSPNLISLSGLECGICYQTYSVNNFTPWTCIHWKQCCTRCLDEWTSRCFGVGSEVTCPMCRCNI
jgi:hypothetical protein